MSLAESINPAEVLPTEDGLSAATLLPLDQRNATVEVETATFGLG